MPRMPRMVRIVIIAREDGVKLDCPNELNIYLTERCNLDCAYCFIEKKTSCRTKLSTPVLRKAIAFFLYSNTAEKKQICFSGGEPFLQEKILRSACDYARRICPDPARLSLNIVTNGTLLSESSISFLKHDKIDLKISIDGKRQDHDRNRPFLEKNGSTYDAVLKNVNKLKREKIGVGANLVFTPFSLRNLLGNIRHLQKFGFKQIDFYPALYAQWSRKDFSAFQDAFAKFTAYYIAMPKKAAPFFQNSLLINIMNKRGLFEQQVCRKIILGWDGNYYCCDKALSLDPAIRKKFIVGDVNQGLDNRLRARLLGRLRREFVELTGGVCQRCRYQAFCFCPVGHYIFFSSHGMDFISYFPQFCRLAKIYIGSMLEIKRELASDFATIKT